MKELTIEEKAKAYDKALERMKSWVRGEHPECFTEAQKAAEFIFPELKENEDEKIRKAILALVRQSSEVLDKQNQNNMIAWLEKQGEQKPYGQRKKCSDCQFNYAGECKGSCQIKRDEQKPADFYCQENCKGFQETGKCFADGDCKAKREAESVDKVEPKFHEEDWIVQGYNILKIKCVGNTHYCFETVSGYVDDMLISEIDSQFHLWTIADAKDGDVLVINNEIFIYAHRKQMYSIAVAHCFVDSAGGFYLDGEFGYTENGNSIHPATKEQRTSLFQKIKEAGYEWDAEKKELKKIEQEHTKYSEEDELSCFESSLFTAFSDAWQQYLRGKEVDIAQWAKEQSKELLEAAKEELVERNNSTWSEEDEKKRTLLISILNVNHPNGYFKVNPANTLNMEAMHTEELVDWLKSLKDRYTWKPSDEQMKALHDLNLTGNISYAGQGQILIELYNNLKKLTE